VGPPNLAAPPLRADVCLEVAGHGDGLIADSRARPNVVGAFATAARPPSRAPKERPRMRFARASEPVPGRLSEAPRYNVDGAKVKEGTANTKTAIGWGTLTLSGRKGRLPGNRITCHN
jgi:hypothetical protein